MTLFDEPSPVERLARLSKGARSQFEKHHRNLILSTLIVVMGVFYYSDFSSQHAHAQEPQVFSDETYAYYACTFHKQLVEEREGIVPDPQTALVEPACFPEAQRKEFEEKVFAEKIGELVANYPIAQMSDAIAAQDEVVAALLVGIAKKESDWGRRVPRSGGADCFNYWGLKGAGSRGQAQGYACFGTPDEAVAKVGERIAHFAIGQGRDTPAKMLVWKCGSSCEGHPPENVASWVNQIHKYYSQVLEFGKSQEQPLPRLLSFQKIN